MKMFRSNSVDSRSMWLSAVARFMLSLVFVAVGVLATAQAQTATYRRHIARIALPLTVYFVDVEGGQSTLFVTPSHQSLLIDTGWGDHDDRDANRIVAVAKQAGLNHIDTLLITHFHDDHVGGVPNLARKIPYRYLY